MGLLETLLFIKLFGLRYTLGFDFTCLQQVLTVKIKLASNSKQSSCLSLLSTDCIDIFSAFFVLSF